ncbi:MAG: hypothetical protein KIC56_05715 [Clostridium sp.]|nr:hypothetical protein [Clostridium sp.]
MILSREIISDASPFAVTVTVRTSPFRVFSLLEFSEKVVELFAVEFTGFSAANVIVEVPKTNTQANKSDKSLKCFFIDFSSILLE